MAKKQPSTAPAKPVEAEVLPALPEQELIKVENTSIGAFLANVVAFFREATQLEGKARASLAEAKTFTLPQPGDADGDAALQRFIKDASAQKKAIEQHWSITSVASQFHKKLVAGRQRGVLMLEDASAIAQRLHNTYAEDAKRRADEETRRLQREAEARAQADRDAELARLEQDALTAEAQSADLSDRERQFVELVANGFNTPDTAARTAGFKDPQKQAARLMMTPKIQTAIKALKDAAEIRRQKMAVAAAPLRTVEPEVAKPAMEKVGTDRSTHAGEVIDERLLIEAILGGKHGIPTDILTVNPAKLNEYARSLHELIDRWPGVRYKKTTKTV